MQVSCGVRGRCQGSPGVLLEKAIELFLDQHAMVHSGRMAKGKPWSFEDGVLNGMTDDQIRCIPPKSEHSIAWIIFSPRPH
jgi:hypothetical protein